MTRRKYLAGVSALALLGAAAWFVAAPRAGRLVLSEFREQFNAAAASPRAIVLLAPT